MKSVLFLISIFLVLNLSAQTTANALFKKGTELEYKSHCAMFRGLGKLKSYETTHFKLIVTDVKDSNNMTYSFITKKAWAVKNPSIGYEKQFVLSRSGDAILLP